MAREPLSDAEIARLRKLVGMLGSFSDNEKLVALRQIEKLAAAKGLHIHEILLDPPTRPAPAPPPEDDDDELDWDDISPGDWRGRLSFLLQIPSALSSWEVNFALSVMDNVRSRPSAKQQAIIDRVCERYQQRRKWQR